MAYWIGQRMAQWLVLGLVIYGSFRLLWLYGMRDPDWSFCLSTKDKVRAAYAAAAFAALLVHAGRSFWPACFGGCLLTACVMDLKEKQIYRYVWIVSLVPVTVMCAQAHPTARDFLTDAGSGLALFCVLQFAVFGHMYGRADCYAFCVCAFALHAVGGTFAAYVYHMSVTFLLLVVTQLCRRNVTIRGRLKEPVAMVPYITAGFWVLVDFAGRK